MPDPVQRWTVIECASTGVYRASAASGAEPSYLRWYVSLDDGALALDCTVLPESEWRVDR